MKFNLAMIACVAAVALVTPAKAERITTGCMEPEKYFDMVEYNESVQWLGLFGPETGMPDAGELISVKGQVFDVRFYDDAICVNRAENHTKYNVTTKG